MSDEGLLAYIVQLEKMFAKADAENARLRADAVALQSVMERMREWESLVLHDRATVTAENARLTTWLRVIANHPVEDSGMWEVGAREMLRCARAALAGEKKDE